MSTAAPAGAQGSGRRVGRSALLMASGLAMAVEEPAYTSLRSDRGFEVRRYEACVVAETFVAAPASAAAYPGFRRLASYIFGRNGGSRRIAMTAPVVQAPVRIAMTTSTVPGAEGAGFVV